jgi:diguanylate cyclase (GGDEF)-like protein/PAS domain S-box-containing protein
VTADGAIAGPTLAALLEAVPLPLLVLDGHGVLRAVTHEARQQLPELDRWIGHRLDEAVGNGEQLRARLRECRASSQVLPVRLAWGEGEAARSCHAGLRFLRGDGPGGGHYLASIRPHLEAVRGFVVLRDHLARLDAEIVRRDRAEAALRTREAWLRVVLQSIADAVLATDADERVTWMNPAAEAMTGWSLDEAQGHPLGVVMQLLHQDTRAPVVNPVTVALAERQPTGMLDDTVLRRRDGSEIGVEDSASPIIDGRGRLIGAVMVFHDVTERRRMVREMAMRATHDALTGLANRTEFELRLARALDDAAVQGVQHSVMYVDLDHFKVVNDTSGHPVGDALLREVAGMLVEVVRGSDVVARLGGDEFGILLPHCDIDSAMRVAEGLLRRLEHFRFESGGRRFRIGASIGLVGVCARWTSIDAVMQAADTACYSAKDAGGQRVTIWNEEGETADMRGRMAWVHRLTDALEEDRFLLYLQRVHPVAHADGLHHAEVLLRLRGDDDEVIAPGAFLPAAERFGLSPAIDAWVLRRVLAHLDAAPEAPVRVAVNFSGQSLGDRGFREAVLAELAQVGPGDCRRLCVELTETEVVSNLQEAASFMQALRARGVTVALDDFGAGASSFTYLRELPADVLKIDGQFIEGLPGDALSGIAVRCFLDAARVTGARCVAERVETAAQLEALRDLGVDHVQGWLLHRPRPWAEVWAAMLSEPAPGVG